MDEQGEQPNNVRPLTGSHYCASCNVRVEHAQRFELSAHTPECRQPEIRMRRAEAEIDELRATVLALARYVLTPGACLAPEEHCGASDLCPHCSTSGQFHGTCGINETVCRLINEASRKTHGNSEASPDTQRSAGNDPERERRLRCHGDAGTCSYCPDTQDLCSAHANASAAEPASTSE